MNRRPLWGLLSMHFGTLTPAFGSSPIAIPAYQVWPTWDLPHWRAKGSFKKPLLLYTRLKFENKSRVNPPLRLLIIRFTRCNCYANPSNPEGNFGRNQLLDGSMGLSPLYPSLTNDLHVSIAADFHQGFPWLLPPRA